MSNCLGGRLDRRRCLPVPWSAIARACPAVTAVCPGSLSHRAVMKTLGHSQIGLTMNTYTHVLSEIEREAIDAAAKVIFE